MFSRIVRDSAGVGCDASMPFALRERLSRRVARLRQSPLAAWKDALITRMDPREEDYGFPDAVIYSLKSSDNCAR
jgi:hypothetical protein